MADWNPQANDIFLRSLDIRSPEKRLAFLDSACAGNTALRAQVDSLLIASDQAGSFLDSPALALNATSDQPNFEHPGTTIGPYNLLEQIGEGGMGVVYMADQQVPIRRRVALKIIKVGMDTRQVIARFEAEREVLALMDHANIARVLDAGATESGRPYFVMELVRGIPITEYCDQNNLPIHERLELFVQVCHAVQHAHQKGIIHRDLKPSNVLVTLHDGRPVPKVIDFGVAKATNQQLTEKTLFTAFAQMVGTPLYMSPEQAEMSGLDIDTRSDIYSLGVLLYELLTGTTPLDQQRLRAAAYDEMRRILREEEPPKPSTRISTLGESRTATAAHRQIDAIRLGQLIKGDLDWIVMKSLQKDRARRYETASNFAADVLRHLHDQPVEACPPSTAYRIRKFVRRNRLQVAAAVVVVLALVGGIVGTTWQALRAKQAETAALNQKGVAIAAKKEALGEADRKRRLLYSADVHLASEVWQAEDGTASQCNELLRAHLPEPGQPDLREFSWRYQWGLMRRGAEVRLSTVPETLDPGARDHGSIARFSSSPRSAGVTADNRAMALDGKGNLSSWLIGDRRLPQQLRLGGGDLIDVTVSRAGEVAAVIESEGGPKIFDARTGLPKGAIRAPSALTHIRLSSDGRFLVGVGRDQHARVWDVASGKELYDYPLADVLARGVIGMDLSLDGKLLLLSGINSSPGPTVILYQDGRPTANILDNEVGTGFLRYQGALSPDGKLAAVGSAGGYVDLYDTKTLKKLGALRAGSATYLVAFSPDSSQLAVGEKSGLVTLWDISRQQIVRTLKGHESTIGALVFSSDGKKLLSIDRSGVARCWDLGVQEESRVVVKDRGEISGLSYSPDCRWLVVANWTNQIWLQDLRFKDPPRLLSTSGSRCAVFSPDGRTIAGGADGIVRVWEAETGRQLCSLSESPDEIGSMAFSPDGRWLAVGFGGPNAFSEDGPEKVTLFDVKNHKEQWTCDTSTQVSAVSFSPDGKLLAAAGHDGTIWLWDVASWDNVSCWKGPAGAKYASILFLPGARELAIGCASGMIDLWDISTGTLSRTLRGHADCVCVMALSPDGRTLATGSWDCSIKLWDCETFRELRTLHGDNFWLYALAFSPDGNTLASGGVEGVLRFWEAPSMEAVTGELQGITEPKSSSDQHMSSSETKNSELRSMNAGG